MFALAACGDTTEDANANESDDSTATESTSDATEETEADVEEVSDVSDSSFDNGDYVYEIKNIEQLDGKYDMPILAVEMSFINNTDEPQSPWMSVGIEAVQETDVTVEMLTGANGQFPDDYKTDLVEMGDTNVKPGATVDAVIGFEIIYPGEPVTLKNFSFTDEVLFETTVETTE